MILFIKKEDRIDKFLVEFNSEELEKIRIEIIEKCSELVHHEYECSGSLPKDFADNPLKIRNFKETKIGKKEHETIKHGYTVEKQYHYSYDELEYPYLVTLINRILKGDVSAVYEILNPDFNKERKSFDERISEITNEINDSNLDNNRKISKLNRVKKLIENKELNKNQESVLEYYEKVKELIILTRIDLINIKSLERIIDFFDIEQNTTIIKTKIYELKK